MKNNYVVVIGCDKNIPFNHNINDLDTLKIVKKAGFKKIFLSFKYGEWSEYQKFMYDYAKSLGFEIPFVHMSYMTNREISKIWHEDKQGDKIVNGYIKDLTEIKKLGISMVVMHVSSTNENPPLSEIGVKRWRKIAKHAEKIGITIALENTVWPNVLEYILDNIESDALKICYDAGHDHTFFKNTFNFDRFKNQIVLTHLHDNDQSADQHLIPFDGTIDWKKVLTNLKIANYNYDLITEAVYRDAYTNICTPLQFYKRLFKRMQKLEKLTNK